MVSEKICDAGGLQKSRSHCLLVDHSGGYLPKTDDSSELTWNGLPNVAPQKDKQTGGA